MKAAVLFSGGKDSTYSAYLAKSQGYELACLISIMSSNPDSFMFHTPSIEKTKKQAEVMDIPIIVKETKGEKEKELTDLQEAIHEAKEKYNIDTIVTGAIQSNYQASRIQKICNKLGLKCFSPLWKKPGIEYLNELIDNGFKVIITGVAAHPLDRSWLGREIDEKFIMDVKELNEKYGINPAGEGGEFETFVLYCPLFQKELKVINKEITGKDNSWRGDLILG